MVKMSFSQVVLELGSHSCSGELLVSYSYDPGYKTFLAHLHEVHRAIVVTSVVRVYVYVYVRVTLSVKVFFS